MTNAQQKQLKVGQGSFNSLFWRVQFMTGWSHALAEYHSSKEVTQKSFLTSCRREAKEQGLEARDNLQGYLHHTKSALQRGADGSRGKVSGQNELRVLKCYPHTSQARTRMQSENDKGWVGSDGKDWIEQSSGDDDVKRNLRNYWRTFR